MIPGIRRVLAWLMLGLCLIGVQSRAETTEEALDVSRDALVYKDGDRVYGKLVQQVGNVIVFRSDRFGELRVFATDAVVIRATTIAKTTDQSAAKPVVAQGIHPKPAAAAAAAEPEEAHAPETPEDRAEKEKLSLWNLFSPAVMTARVREFFGPWHGRVAVSNDIVTDTSDRRSLAVDTRIARKFKKDAIELTGRYDYNNTNEVTTSDTLKGAGSWRHDFDRRKFGQYRPTVEWNRASTKNGVRAEYVLLQQEIGFGFNVIIKPTRKLRLGVSQNLFDTWTYSDRRDDTGHGSRGVESFFDELELTLPWRMTLTQRGVWYPVEHETDGFENRVELNKKLSETLSLALRHEFRRNNPDGSSQDYTKLRLLLGFDF
ncbi:DUF481 domain-containing protein [Opitutus sp. ER46]|uniref:DUF481 domain-containing protein n=1 Tax=Opitutus sp. ER46 TaxID=2161864 RepID=UPI0011B227DD|nr:DUF481 domain-containing protein [Opitutus sp. ER46]